MIAFFGKYFLQKLERLLELVRLPDFISQGIIPFSSSKSKSISILSEGLK